MSSGRALRSSHGIGLAATWLLGLDHMLGALSRVVSYASLTSRRGYLLADRSFLPRRPLQAGTAEVSFSLGMTLSAKRFIWS